MLLVLSLPALALAQVPDTEILEDEVKETTAKGGELPEGWSFGLTLGANSAFNHNSSVVGNPDGSTFQFGVVLDGQANLRDGQHEWRNVLKLQETFTKVPTLTPFLKTMDLFDLRSTYLYKIPGIEWLGPFARVRFTTALFPGWDVRPDEREVVRRLVDGTETTTATAGQTRIKLTSAFEPIQLREAAGLFARAIDLDEVRLDFHAGIGSQQIFTQGGFVVDSDRDGVLTLQQLRDFVQVGGQIDADAGGALNELLTWRFAASLFHPFYTSVETELEGVDLLNVEIETRLSLKLAEWASLDYVLMVRRIPLLLNEWQVQNGLILNTGFTLL